MAKLLKVALDEGRYDLAAYVIVYGLIRAKQNEKKKQRKTSKSGLLRQGA